jgi:LPXTG-motif cell wall-anchored protein
LTSEVDGMPGTGDHTTGMVSVNVRNNAGTTLPSTGGVGTTMFYIAGGIMVAVAIVLLVTKKRMAEEQ